MTDPAHGPDQTEKTARPPAKHRHDPGQDLLILVIVVMCSIIAVKLVMEFAEWNKLQTCISSGRNCAPRTTGP